MKSSAKRKTHDEMLFQFQTLAKAKKGKCLEKTYLGIAEKHRLQCKEGHEFDMLLSNLTKGAWCKTCNIADRYAKRLIIMQGIAKANGGKLISKEYKNVKLPLTWQCVKCHIWEATPDNISAGAWCHQCAHERRSSTQKGYTNDDLSSFAKSRKGKLVSKAAYTNSVKKHVWRCASGHEWKATFTQAKNIWCKLCSTDDKQHGHLSLLKSIARLKRGKLLSPTLKNVTIPLLWQCKEKHQWAMPAYKVYKKHWCPQCRIEKEQKLASTRLAAFLKLKGATLVVGKYINQNSPLTIKCSMQHTWQTTWKNIVAHAWCPECATEKRRLKIEDRLMKLIFIRQANIVKGIY